ncbi:NAD(P)-dependent alcohol dehydrogenase [Kitasatospora sp. NPDC094019]|uniref:NAD(P)-dependent alcohol dehydrogenase n=1 Tax=Kitasatospora sp. NPDC094019 TaxID=3364091 RepID=UPI00382A1977
MSTTGHGTTDAGGRPEEAGGTGSMRAIVQDGYGPPDVLRLAEVPRPAAAAHELLVRVRAAGVDRGTWHIMAGRPYAVRAALGLRRPRNPVLGMELAGTVVAVGSGVSGFAVGDDVFGIGRGSFAEYATARADRVAHKPAAMTFEQAAVLAISGTSALQALGGPGRVRQGHRVLVIGASGGVGAHAVQLAKAYGAEVTGVCRTDKTDLVRSLGADHVIDYTRTDCTDGDHRYDLIVDTGGNTRLSRLRRVLTPRGTLVIVGGEDAGDWLGLGRQFRALLLSVLVRQRLTMLTTRQRSADLEILGELVESGRLTPVVGTTLPLAQASEAVSRLEAGQARGKIALTV